MRLDGQARIAKALCRDRPGRRAMAITVTWRPDGSVENVLVDGGTHGDQAVFCVQTQFWASKIDEFTGAEQSLAVSVVLD
jgi:hypothetical protein